MSVTETSDAVQRGKGDLRSAQVSALSSLLGWLVGWLVIGWLDYITTFMKLVSAIEKAKIK
jgi:hypothetical protein